MTRKILYLSKGDGSASTRYRAKQFFPLLRQSGFDVSHATVSGSLNSYFRALLLAREADIVVVLRKTFPEPFAYLLRIVSRNLVFDFDDSIFCNTDGSVSTTRMRRFKKMVSRCDHLFAGNHFLAQEARKRNPNVSVIPTCVVPERYAGSFDKPVEFIDLVWIGSSSTRKYLVDALPALRKALLLVPNLRLKIVADFQLPGAGIPIMAVPWSEHREAEYLGSAHIGIAPMSDDDWSRGKCGLKVLQYMAAGLPVISSASGANANLVVPGVTGFLVSNEVSWSKCIAELAVDAGLRERLGQEGRRQVMENYSVDSVFSRIRLVFDALS